MAARKKLASGNARNSGRGFSFRLEKSQSVSPTLPRTASQPCSHLSISIYSNPREGGAFYTHKYTLMHPQNLLQLVCMLDAIIADISHYRGKSIFDRLPETAPWTLEGCRTFSSLGGFQAPPTKKSYTTLHYYPKFEVQEIKFFLYLRSGLSVRFQLWRFEFDCLSHLGVKFWGQGRDSHIDC